DAWKARGINTVVEIPQGHDPLAWARAADAKGLDQIRRPAGDPASDLKDVHLIAWATDDEPSDTRVGRVDYGSVAHDPAEVVKQAAPWRAAAKAAGRFVPIWTNHIGGHIYPDWAQNNAIMRDYMHGPASDWLASDPYPVQERRALVIASNDGYASTVHGISLDRQRAWSDGKPVMSFIGTSPFGEGTPVPTPAEFNLMAWSSVIHGAVGIIYFPERLSPAFSFDATPPELVSAIARFDQQVGAMNSILMDPKAGGRTPFRLFRSASAGARPMADQLPYPFEATEIATPEGPYRIVLNLSSQDQVFDKPSWGLKQVTIAGYGVHIGLATPNAP
ncbi:hypothetical protein, partial [Phenylobacterium sp.]|uniref:hypothetical protein n=1 Tax=Phenylobacterium sp. TaxID=1871053 RepID=UPI0025E642D0